MAFGENLLIDTYDQAYARNSGDLAATAVVASLPVKELRSSHNAIVDSFYGGFYSEAMIEIDIEHHKLSSALQPGEEFTKRRTEQLLQEKLKTLRDQKVRAEEDMAKARCVKERQHTLGKRITSLLVAGGILIGASAMEVLDVNAQRGASRFVLQEGAKPVPVYSHRPIDLFIDGLGAAAGAEAGIISSLFVAPIYARRRARKILKRTTGPISEN